MISAVKKGAIFLAERRMAVRVGGFFEFFIVSMLNFLILRMSKYFFTFSSIFNIASDSIEFFNFKKTRISPAD